MAYLISLEKFKNNYTQGIAHLYRFSSPHLVKVYYVADCVKPFTVFLLFLQQSWKVVISIPILQGRN